MAISNKRKAIKKSTPDAKLKSRLKEDFEWMTEDDATFEDDSLESGVDAEGADFSTETGDELPVEDGTEGDVTTDDIESELTPNQEEQLDDEVDQLLQLGLEDETEDTLTEDEDTEVGALDIEDSSDDITSDVMGGTDEVEPVTDLINTDDLQSIIDSPDSLHALENDLVSKITSEEDGEELTENEDPFKGIDELGFDLGYEGKDVKDELTEEVDLASELAALDFSETSEGLNDKITSTVSDAGIEGGADSNVELVQESIKKSKMLVKAAATILKLKQMQEAAQRQAQKLQFENAKLQKVNALLAVAGDKMEKDVRKKIVESFTKCKTTKEVNTLYSKVVNVIKEHSKPSLNKTVAKAKPTQVKTVKKINESANREEVKLNMSKHQMRKNYLMGMQGDDMYYNFD